MVYPAREKRRYILFRRRLETVDLSSAVNWSRSLGMLLTTASHRAGYVLFFRSRRNTRLRSGVERSYSRGFLRVRGCFGISQDHARVSGCCIKHPRQRSLPYIATCCLAAVGILDSRVSLYQIFLWRCSLDRSKEWT